MSALIAIVAGFSSGVGLRSLYFDSWWPLLFVVLLAALVGAALYLQRRRVYVVMLLFFLCAALGMFRAAVADTPLPQTFLNDLRHRIAYNGVVVGDPDVREKNQRIALVVEKGGERVGALAVMPLTARVRVGDRVRVYGTLSLPQSFETEYGRTFRYDRYLEARGIRFLIQFGSIYVREPAPLHSLPAALARVKHAFLDGLNRALPAPASALAGGIVIGGKTGLGSELQDAFIRSGLVQIIVLSGYNVMIVAEWMMLFLTYLQIPRRLRFFAGGAALLLFVGIAGLSATAVRAAIMAIIALYARATGRSYAASRALLFAVLVMLLWNPLWLCFDPGFALSVAATAGIIWLSPIIEAGLNAVRLSKFRGLTKSTYVRPFLINAIATTLAAQIAVLPLLLYNIGLFSAVALPANLLVNPLVPLAMAGAAVAGVVGMLLGAWAPLVVTVVGYPVLVLTNYFIWIAKTSATLPYATFTVQQFPFLFVGLAYAVLAYVAFANRSSITDQFTLAKNAST